jgi:hypothetical protein
MMRTRLPLSLFLCTALLLPARETVAVGVATPMVVQKRHVNLANATYAAADTVVQQTSVRLDRNAPFVIHALDEVDHTAKEGEESWAPRRKVHPNPNLGKAITNRLVTRIRELGYNVVDASSAPKAGTELRGIYDVYGGNFLDRNQKLKVTLQLTDIASGRIVSDHDFIIPVTDEVREYMDSGNVLLPKLLTD